MTSVRRELDAHEEPRIYREWLARADGEHLRARETVSWRNVRFVGVFDRDTVHDPIGARESWTRRLHALLERGEIPETIAVVTPVGGYVHPRQIDWTGYRHAGGDATRRARSGPTPTEAERRERGGSVGVPLRIPQELLAAIDAARGDVSRNAWVIAAARAALEIKS